MGCVGPLRDTSARSLLDSSTLDAPSEHWRTRAFKRDMRLLPSSMLAPAEYVGHMLRRHMAPLVHGPGRS